MGLYESTIQHIITGSYMLLNYADDKGKVNVSRTKKRTNKQTKRGGEKKGQG
jgi:hypothetical protein